MKPRYRISIICFATGLLSTAALSQDVKSSQRVEINAVNPKSNGLVKVAGGTQLHDQQPIVDIDIDEDAIEASIHAVEEVVLPISVNEELEIEIEPVEIESIDIEPLETGPIEIDPSDTDVNATSDVHRDADGFMMNDKEKNKVKVKDKDKSLDKSEKIQKANKYKTKELKKIN